MIGHLLIYDFLRSLPLWPGLNYKANMLDPIKIFYFKLFAIVQTIEAILNKQRRRLKSASHHWIKNVPTTNLATSKATSTYLSPYYIPWQWELRYILSLKTITSKRVRRSLVACTCGNLSRVGTFCGGVGGEYHELIIFSRETQQTKTPFRAFTARKVRENSRENYYYEWLSTCIRFDFVTLLLYFPKTNEFVI